MGTNLVGLLLPDLATVTSALEVLGCSPWALFLEMSLSDSLFLGGGITGRDGSSGMSGSSLLLIPNTSKGSGDPKPNLIRIINFVRFQWFCSFSKRMRTFSQMHRFSEYSRSFSWQMRCFMWQMHNFT